MGSGLLLATFIREPWQLYLTLGALVGGGVNCLAYTGQSLYLTNWFVRRRGLALSIAFSGVGAGSVIVLPWLQSLITSTGWRAACWALGHHRPGDPGAVEPFAEAATRRSRP
jgi:MFS family permease